MCNGTSSEGQCVTSNPTPNVTTTMSFFRIRARDPVRRWSSRQAGNASEAKLEPPKIPYRTFAINMQYPQAPVGPSEVQAITISRTRCGVRGVSDLDRDLIGAGAL